MPDEVLEPTQEIDAPAPVSAPVAEPKPRHRPSGAQRRNEALERKYEAKAAARAAGEPDPPDEEEVDDTAPTPENRESAIESLTTNKAVPKPSEKPKPEKKPVIPRQTLDIAESMGYDAENFAAAFDDEERALRFLGSESARRQREAMLRQAAEPTETQPSRIFDNPLKDDQDVAESVATAFDKIHDPIQSEFAALREENRKMAEEMKALRQHVTAQQTEHFNREYAAWVNQQPEHVRPLLLDEDKKNELLSEAAAMAKFRRENRQPVPPRDQLMAKAMWAVLHDELLETERTRVSQTVQKRNGTPMARPMQRRGVLTETDNGSVNEEAVLAGKDQAARWKLINARLDRRMKEAGYSGY